jgi:hypothetical protein
MSENVEYTEDDLGKVVSIKSKFGTYEDERIVMVHCDVCGARFIGPIREAGGFLGGHGLYHNWEAQQAALIAEGYGV